MLAAMIDAHVRSPRTTAIWWSGASGTSLADFRVSGKGFGISQESSLAFGAARKWNFFGMADSVAAQSLMKLEQALRRPGAAARMSNDPAVAALLMDPRFRVVVEDPKVQQAVEHHDVVMLLRADSVVKLFSDSESRTRLFEAMAALQTSGAAEPAAAYGAEPTK